jgi:hypothetical protein
MRVMRCALCVVLACVCWEAILQGVMFPSASQLGTEDTRSMREGLVGDSRDGGSAFYFQC